MLKFSNMKIYMYSCSIKFLEQPIDELYDWSADILSFSWDAAKAMAKVKRGPQEMVCDVLLDPLANRMEENVPGMRWQGPAQSFRSAKALQPFLPHLPEIARILHFSTEQGEPS